MYGRKMYFVYCNMTCRRCSKVPNEIDAQEEIRCGIVEGTPIEWERQVRQGKEEEGVGYGVTLILILHFFLFVCNRGGGTKLG